MSTEKYIDLIGVINTAVRGQSGTVVQFGSTSDLDRREVLAWLDAHPGQVPGRTITESSDRYVFDGASVLAVEFGRVVESDDGYLQPHPEFPDRHTITAMLKDGDHLPTVGAKDRITVIIEKADPEPTNAEKLEQIIMRVDADRRGGYETFADALDKAGVKAPEEDDD